MKPFVYETGKPFPRSYFWAEATRQFTDAGAKALRFSTKDFGAVNEEAKRDLQKVGIERDWEHSVYDIIEVVMGDLERQTLHLEVACFNYEEGRWPICQQAIDMVLKEIRIQEKKGWPPIEFPEEE